MLNEQKLKQILTSFTTYLPQHWDDMKPIWESIAHFQKYWDIDAEDFGAMYMEATRKHNGLLSQIYAYPREVKILWKEWSFCGENIWRISGRNIIRAL